MTLDGQDGAEPALGSGALPQAPAQDRLDRPASAEAVRLVIWDLDDTFWQGTISEGGIDYSAAHHEIVIALARRGIMSSICSKNDLEPVRERLIQEGIWDYFIFPSIDWSPKGARLKALIEAVQLRPQSVLFIDDNPMNLAEAEYCVPGIQVARETAIADLLSRPTCKGKDDAALSRLEQYRLLQARTQDIAAAASDGKTNSDFLRASNVRVTIDYDVAKHLDRAIELINRTNQLNFTKVRLSEHPAEARRELTKLLKDYRSLAGLVRVQDNYGDYGHVGLFIVRQNQHGNKLLHFCFSCRTLNMGVETWVYNHLGRPKLKVVGEVANDPRVTGEPVDWITLTDPADGAGSSAVAKEFDHIYLRGSCDLRPLEHFFGSLAHQVVGEFTFMRGGAIFRPDHSLLMAYAAEGVDRAFADQFSGIGLTHAELGSPMFDAAAGRNIYLLSFNADLYLPIYRHRPSGKLMPFPSWERGKDLTRQPLERNGLPAKTNESTICELVENYEFIGITHEAIFRRNLRTILGKLPHDGLIIVLTMNEGDFEDPTLPLRRLHNHSMRMIAEGRPDVVVLSLTDFVHAPDERHTIDHFDRRVYTRFFDHVRALGRERLAHVPMRDRTPVSPKTASEPRQAEGSPEPSEPALPSVPEPAGGQASAAAAAAAEAAGAIVEPVTASVPPARKPVAEHAAASRQASPLRRSLRKILRYRH